MSFAAHVSLVDRFLNGRRPIVERIERLLLNVRDKSLAKSRNRAQFAQLLDLCFWGLPGLPPELVRLKGDLAARHRADGFEPVQLDAFANELDPLELVVRAYGQWDATRWPGAAGRLAFADTIFAVFVLRQLEHLSLRVWDDGRDQAAARLADVQRLLDELNAQNGGGVLVRDACWLLQTGLGPFTKHLRPYFDVADRVAGLPAAHVRLGVHRAGAVLAGGHLRSQLHYRMWQTQLPIDDPENLAFTRNSNALDNALLVRDLVPLLRAYKTACEEQSASERHVLADAIVQGLAADPELFVARLDLLTPYTIIEDLFVQRIDGRVTYSATGRTHVETLADFATLLGENAPALRADAERLAPARAGYSPLGITYGFCADIMSNMAMDTLVGQPSFGLSLEDVFVTDDRAEEKLARARGWQRLPRRPGENEHFDYSTTFAARIFEWLVDALDARASRPGDANVSRQPSSRVFVTRESSADGFAQGVVPDGTTPADDYRLDTNPTRASHTGATAWPLKQLLADRVEGRLLASADGDGGWTGISKIVLTRLTGQATDALITHVADDVIDTLTLTCPGLVTDLSPRRP